MSLVDYASSDEEEKEVREEILVERDKSQGPRDDAPIPQSNQRLEVSSNQQAKSYSNQSEPSVLKLPNASLLLNSPASSHLVSGFDHSSLVAAAVTENASRKRESNGSASTYPRTKVPRATLLHSKNVPDTVGGVLIPPQLTGRSNVVTEDISKLFVRKHAVHPSSR